MNKILLFINKLIRKILNNKKFVNFSIILTLFFITFILTNERNKFTQTLIILTKLSSIKILLILFILFISYYNFSLGLLYLITIIILMNMPSYIEDFSSIPNLIDKKKIIKFNKNFKNPKRLTEEKSDIKKINNEERNVNNESDNESEKQEIKKKKKKNISAISQDYNDEIKSNIEEVNLDDKEDTIENELKKKHTNEYKKLEEFESSSSESSNSDSSDSSTDSSDSEKELNDVSMDVARNHMLNKLRSGLKKKYLND